MSRRPKVRHNSNVPDSTMVDGKFQNLMGQLLSRMRDEQELMWDDIDELEKAEQELLAAIAAKGGEPQHAYLQQKVDKLEEKCEKLGTKCDTCKESQHKQDATIGLFKQKQDLMWKVLWGVGGAAGLAIVKHIIDLLVK